MGGQITCPACERPASRVSTCAPSVGGRTLVVADACVPPKYLESQVESVPSPRPNSSKQPTCATRGHPDAPPTPAPAIAAPSGPARAVAVDIIAVPGTQMSFSPDCGRAAQPPANQLNLAARAHDPGRLKLEVVKDRRRMELVPRLVTSHKVQVTSYISWDELRVKFTSYNLQLTT